MSKMPLAEYRAMMAARASDPDVIRARIARRVKVTDNNCWVWQGFVDKWGYGTCKALGTMRRAHRVSYAAFVDATPLPQGWSLDHLCHNADASCAGGVSCPHRACVNPAHLEAVPHIVNVRRGNSGRHWRDRTHCKRGHEFTPENTRLDARGARVCRAFKRESWHRCKARKRLAA